MSCMVCVCAGCLSPLPITSLKDYALTSALKDRRFSPIDACELPHLHCVVSLLTNFEVACSLDDWTIGPHGVKVDFVDPAGQVPGCRGAVVPRAIARAPRTVHPRFPHRCALLPPQARTAVYLPDVIPEQGWSKAETIDSLIRKSGYTGQASAPLPPDGHTSAESSPRPSKPIHHQDATKRPCTLTACPPVLAPASPT